MMMCHLNVKLGSLTEEQTHQYIQTYSLKKGLKKFGDHGKAAAVNKMSQLHEHAVFEPIRVKDMTQVE